MRKDIVESVLGQSRPAFESERRGNGRTRVLIPAFALCPDGRVVSCVLRDMSPSGARIGVAPRHALPAQFQLVTDSRPHGYPVRMVWRRGAFAGVTLDLPEAR